MWKLLVLVFVLDDAGQVAPVRGEHPQLFASAQDCYEAAAELYQDAGDRVHGISILCAKEPERQA